MALTDLQLGVIDSSVGARIEVCDSSGLYGSTDFDGVVVAVDSTRDDFRVIEYRTVDTGEVRPFGFAVDYAHSGYDSRSTHLRVTVPLIGRCIIYPH